MDKQSIYVFHKVMKNLLANNGRDKNNVNEYHSKSVYPGNKSGVVNEKL